MRHAGPVEERNTKAVGIAVPCKMSWLEDKLVQKKIFARKAMAAKAKTVLLLTFFSDRLCEGSARLSFMVKTGTSSFCKYIRGFENYPKVRLTMEI